MPEKTLKEKVEAGTKYGRWKVVAFAYRDESKYENFWHCECECGVGRVVRESALKCGHSRSCGCYQRDLARKTSRKHGHAKDYKVSGTYTAWSRMVDRCTNPSSASFQYYGARGISVCSRWLGENGFHNFLADMGEKLNGLTLDRIDVNGNYEPGNCRWTTNKEQQNNKRNNVRIQDGDSVLTFQQIAEKYDVDYRALWYQMFKRNLSLEDALAKVRVPKRTVMIEFEGEMLSRSEAACRIGITYDRFKYLHDVKKLSIVEIRAKTNPLEEIPDNAE